MTGPPVLTDTSFKARALLLGRWLELRAFEATDRIASNPLTVSVTGGGVAVLFRYGAVVLFRVNPVEETALIHGLTPSLSQPLAQPEVESVEIRVDAETSEHVEAGVVWIARASVERLQLAAEVLAKSVVLASYEATIAQAFELVEPVAASLTRSAGMRGKGRDLLKLMGTALLGEQTMIGRVAVADKPDLLWERPDLERFYLRLEAEFEIQERLQTLERKLELVTRTAETVRGIQQDTRTLRVEWYIVILIVLEILLTLYDLFFRG
jgi:uncharacterized Rmd1/YagE family protein